MILKDRFYVINQFQVNIENILIKDFGKTTLASLGNVFDAEIEHFNTIKNRLNVIYKKLSDSPKDWEKKALGEGTLTKDFNLME